MPVDCHELRECADLLHEAAEVRMDAAQLSGSHRPGYVADMRKVVALEETAATLEAKLREEC